MNVAIIETGGANLASIRFAFQRLGVEASLASTREQIEAADRVILPGVGAAGTAMERLKARGLVETIRSLKKPTLGICLGLQLYYESSEEGDVDCLGLLPGRVRRLSARPDIAIPHIGWNTLNLLEKNQPCRLMGGIGPASQFYFVHSFRVPDSDCTIATTGHGDTFPVLIQKDNFFGVQFHPEKSSTAGAKILRSFLEL